MLCPQVSISVSLTTSFLCDHYLNRCHSGSWLAARLAKRAGRDPEVILDMLPWLLIGGIIGARLWHVFTPSASNQAMGITTGNYLRNPIEILKIWNGGLGILGGVFGGA